MENPQLIISVLGLIVAMSSATAAYIYFRKSRNYKELSYEILPTLSLVSVGPEVRDRVEIKYKHGDEETEVSAIEDLKAVAITIHNTGTEAVNCKSKDFQDDDPQMPVTLDFGQDAQILGEPGAETNPKGRKVLIRRDPQALSKVLMDTFLLNPKETVTISTFLTNFSKGRPSVDWHIEDVRPPREHKREGRRSWLSGWSGVIVGFLLAIFSIGVVRVTDASGVVTTASITVLFALGAVLWVYFRERVHFRDRD